RPGPRRPPAAAPSSCRSRSPPRVPRQRRSRALAALALAALALAALALAALALAALALAALGLAALGRAARGWHGADPRARLPPRPGLCRSLAAQRVGPRHGKLMGGERVQALDPGGHAARALRAG